MVGGTITLGIGLEDGNGKAPDERPFLPSGGECSVREGISRARREPTASPGAIDPPGSHGTGDASVRGGGDRCPAALPRQVLRPVKRGPTSGRRSLGTLSTLRSFERHADRMTSCPTLSPQRRRRRVREVFDARVAREWRRHEGEPWRVLRRTLRERFLAKHLGRLRGTVLELGPGPGRFTPLLRAEPRRAVLAVDLSRGSLLAARRRTRPDPALAPVDWVEGVGEHLPLRSGSFQGVVALGNIVSFASRDGPALLRELWRVARPRGRLIADFPSPVAATQEFFYTAARNRFLPRVLRERRYYLVDQVLDSGFQPFDPPRLCSWEFRFYTAAEAVRMLRRAGFDVVDTMSVGPVARMDDRVISVARRDPRTWRSLLEIEERAGRRAGVLETGDGFVVCAVRRPG